MENDDRLTPLTNEEILPIEEILLPNIQKGIAYLNETKPGWFLSVNLDTLFLDSCKQCVLGQLYGDYWTQVGSIYNDKPMTHEESADHGFTVPPALPKNSNIRSWEAWPILTDLWKAEIRTIRKENDANN